MPIYGHFHCKIVVKLIASCKYGLLQCIVMSLNIRVHCVIFNPYLASFSAVGIKLAIMIMKSAFLYFTIAFVLESTIGKT